MNNATTSPTFASLVQEFFTDYMVQQRALSPRTVACYRDSFSLLLGFAQQRLGKAPTTLQLADLTQTFLARSVPLWKDTARDVRAWLRLNEQLTADSPLLPTREGHVMTRANVAQRLRLATRAATARHPELAKQSVFPHCIRHTMAMHMLQAGVDISVIALRLGHESPSTTHMYVEADLGMKERALARLDPPNLKSVRFRPSDALLRFLQGL